MAPHATTKKLRKKGKSNALGVVVFSDLSSDSDEPVPKSNKVEKKNAKMNTKQPKHMKEKEKAKPKKKPGRKPTVEEHFSESDDQDELGLGHQHQMSRLSRVPSIDIDKIAKALEGAASSLSAVNAPAELEKLLEKCDLEDPEKLGQIEDNCRTVANALRARRTNDEDLGSGQYKILRASTTSLQLLRVDEAFTSIRSVKAKTFGFIRRKGVDSILKYAISGTKKCLRDHPKVLDNELWSKLSLEYGKRNDFESRSSGFETFRGDEQGSDFACHIERTLTLWYACEMLEWYTKLGKPLARRLKSLHDLTTMRPRVTAEIVLNREPCQNCIDFKDMMQKVTGLRFYFVIIDTLGKLELGRNKHNFAMFPIGSSEIMQALEGFSDDEDSSIAQVSSPATCQVVLPGRAKTPVPNKPNKPSKSNKKHLNHKHKQIDAAQEEEPGSETALDDCQVPKKARSKQVTSGRTSVPQQKVVRNHQHHGHQDHHRSREASVIEVSTHLTIRNLQKFAYQPNAEEAGRKRDWKRAYQLDDLDHAEYTPPKTPKKSKAKYNFPTPDSDPFSREALARAEVIKKDRKKREREMESQAPLDSFLKQNKRTKLR